MAAASRARLGWGLATLVAFLVFAALGTWQLQRRAWKHALIAQVAERLAAAPVPAPGPPAWPAISDGDRYRRLGVQGRFLPGKSVRVQAVTERGPGFWILTPLQADAGFVVLVNRGFVARDRAAAEPPPAAVTVTGLLRLSEPGGAFLRHNDPAADRWYSRDVPAIARTLGLEGKAVAPYFIDADADGGSERADQPVGGLTVVQFRDSHLVYALTWYTLAVMPAAALIVGARKRRRSSQRPR